MLRSQPKIPAPTATQLAEIAELVGRLALTDGQLAAVLRRLKVRGGIEAIPDYFTAQRVLGALEGVRRICAKDGRVDPLYDDAVECVVACGRGSVCEVQRHLGIGSQRASRIIEGMTTAGILGPREPGNVPRRLLAGQGDKDGRSDPLYDKAVECILASGRGSMNELEKCFNIGHRRAWRLIEAMTTDGILGAHCGERQPRKVLIGLKETSPRGSERKG
jgi:DNA segregation ATPase FtsK/SpoIIIE-like protein